MYKSLDANGVARVWSRANNFFSRKEYVDNVAKEILDISIHGRYNGRLNEPVSLVSSSKLVSRMWVDGVRVAPSEIYIFGDIIEHDVWIKLESSSVSDIFSEAEAVYYKTGGYITQINTGAFANSNQLITVVLHDGITSIGDNAFFGCQLLENLICLNLTPPTLGNDAFSGIDNPILWVPSKSMESYINAGWANYFRDVKVVEEWQE